MNDVTTSPLSPELVQWNCNLREDA